MASLKLVDRLIFGQKPKFLSIHMVGKELSRGISEPGGYDDAAKSIAFRSGFNQPDIFHRVSKLLFSWVKRGGKSNSRKVGIIMTPGRVHDAPVPKINYHKTILMSGYANF